MPSRIIKPLHTNLQLYVLRCSYNFTHNESFINIKEHSSTQFRNSTIRWVLVVTPYTNSRGSNFPPPWGGGVTTTRPLGRNRATVGPLKDNPGQGLCKK